MIYPASIQNPFLTRLLTSFFFYSFSDMNILWDMAMMILLIHVSFSMCSYIIIIHTLTRIGTNFRGDMTDMTVYFLNFIFIWEFFFCIISIPTRNNSINLIRAIITGLFCEYTVFHNLLKFPRFFFL